MNTARMAILGVASLAGVGCVGVVLHGMAGAKAPPPPIVAPPPPPPTTVRVLVARHDLNVGDRVQPNDMGWQAWPIDGLNPAFITDGSGAKPSAAQGQLGRAVGKVSDAARAVISNPAEGAGSSFVGAIVRERISMNEPLIATKVVRAGGAGVLAVTLDSGMRAVALPLTAESAAGGFILPGDHVDVLLTRQLDAVAGAASPGHVTSTVMKNVRVLAIDQNMSAQKTASAVGATATVQATPAQAEDLVMAKASGTLTLALRSYADSAGEAQVGSRGNNSAGMTVRVFRSAAATPVTVSQ